MTIDKKWFADIGQKQIFQPKIAALRERSLFNDSRTILGEKGPRERECLRQVLLERLRSRESRQGHLGCHFSLGGGTSASRRQGNYLHVKSFREKPASQRE